MANRVVKASTGAVQSSGPGGDLLAGLTLDDIGELEPDLQDLLRNGLGNLRPDQRQDANRKVFEYFLRKQAQEESNRSFWSRTKDYFALLYGGAQSFVRGREAPTKYSTPPLGQGQNLDYWRTRMARVLQTWRRGRRVDVTQRLTDDGSLTLYFDDFGELASTSSFAARVTKRGKVYSVEYQPGKGEEERVVGDHGRQQLRVFFDMLLEEDRGHAAVFQRFVRRMARAEQGAPQRS